MSTKSFTPRFDFVESKDGFKFSPNGHVWVGSDHSKGVSRLFLYVLKEYRYFVFCWCHYTPRPPWTPQPLSAGQGPDIRTDVRTGYLAHELGRTSFAETANRTYIPTWSFVCKPTSFLFWFISPKLIEKVDHDDRLGAQGGYCDSLLETARDAVTVLRQGVPRWAQ